MEEDEVKQALAVLEQEMASSTLGASPVPQRCPTTKVAGGRRDSRYLLQLDPPSPGPTEREAASPPTKPAKLAAKLPLPESSPLARPRKEKSKSKRVGKGSSDGKRSRGSQDKEASAERVRSQDKLGSHGSSKDDWDEQEPLEAQMDDLEAAASAEAATEGQAGGSDVSSHPETTSDLMELHTEEEATEEKLVTEEEEVTTESDLAKGEEATEESESEDGLVPGLMLPLKSATAPGMVVSASKLRGGSLLDLSEYETPDVDYQTLGDYVVGGQIGAGAFGRVLKGLHMKTGQFAAIKVLDQQSVKFKQVQNEIEILRNVDHKNIIRYIDCSTGELDNNGKPYIVFEYIENGSLRDVLQKFGRFSEVLAAKYVFQTVLGLLYLHQRNILHRDIKAANILITKDGVCKLADFGLAAQMSDDCTTMSAVGTLFWMPPEMFEGSEVSKSGDIWSLGCTIIELLTGHPPFYGMPEANVIFRLVELDEPPAFPPDISPMLHDFLSRCFKKQGSDRSSAEELIRHPWLEEEMSRHEEEEKRNSRSSSSMVDYQELAKSLSEYNKHSKKPAFHVPRLSLQEVAFDLGGFCMTHRAAFEPNAIPINSSTSLVQSDVELLRQRAGLTEAAQEEQEAETGTAAVAAEETKGKAEGDEGEEAEVEEVEQPIEARKPLFVLDMPGIPRYRTTQQMLEEMKESQGRWPYMQQSGDLEELRAEYKSTFALASSLHTSLVSARAQLQAVAKTRHELQQELDVARTTEQQLTTRIDKLERNFPSKLLLARLLLGPSLAINDLHRAEKGVLLIKKLAGKTGNFKGSWKKRYIACQHNLLLIYRSSDLEQPYAVIQLVNQSIEVCTTEAETDGRRNCFVLSLPDSSLLLLLCAASTKIKLKWMRALSMAQPTYLDTEELTIDDIVDILRDTTSGDERYSISPPASPTKLSKALSATADSSTRLRYPRRSRQQRSFGSLPFRSIQHSNISTKHLSNKDRKDRQTIMAKKIEEIRATLQSALSDPTATKRNPVMKSMAELHQLEAVLKGMLPVESLLMADLGTGNSEEQSPSESENDDDSDLPPLI